jgi:hypothetical protein
VPRTSASFTWCIELVPATKPAMSPSKEKRRTEALAPRHKAARGGAIQEENECD